MESFEFGLNSGDIGFDRKEAAKERSAVVEQAELKDKEAETTRGVIQGVGEELKAFGIRTLEFVSQKFGETVGKKVYEYLSLKTEKFETDIVGLENVLDIDGPFIIAPNHTRPSEDWALQTGAHADAVLVEKIIREATGKEVGVVAKGDPGEWGDAALETKKNVLRPIMTGIVRGLGFIPVGLLPGSINRELVERVAESFSRDNPILMFPEGRSYDKFSEDNELKTGISHFSIKHGAPIIPTYIKDCREWKEGSHNGVIFGDPIYPIEGESKTELTERVHAAMVALSKEAEALPI